MHIVNISATTLKNNVSNILNDVYFNKKTAVIKRYGTIIAKIVPVDKKNEDVRTILDKYFGALPDFPDVSKKRNLKKRSVRLWSFGYAQDHAEFIECMRYLLDTDVVVSQLRGKTKIKENIIEKGAAVSIITFGELLYGAEKSANKENSLAIINGFISALQIDILGLNQEIIHIYARTKKSLEETGKGLDEFDLLIGATATFHSMAIATLNLHHFKRIPGIQIANDFLHKA